MNQKTGSCECGQAISIPNSQCLFQCKKCREIALFLCHVIPNPKDLMNIRCKKCKLMYSLFTCPQCSATAVIKDFKSGKKYGCLCGFQSVMLTCNNCISLLCLPPNQNYEGTLITCKKCQQPFKYVLCELCGECIYFKPQQAVKDLQFCFNPKCPKSLENKSLKNAQQEPMVVKKLPPEHEVKQMQNYPELEQLSKKVDVPSDMCKICKRNKNTMINTSCFHLAICEDCSSLTEGKCVICGAIGVFRKVEKG